MNDLIYDATAREEVQRRFPASVIEDASDMIHDSRISVTLPDDRKDEYLRWVVMSGWGLASLGIRVMFYDKENREKVKKWLDEAKVDSPKVY